MARFEIAPGKYRGKQSVRNVIRYILNPEKTPHKIYHAYGNDSEETKHIAQSFLKVQELYRKTSHKRVIHMIVSFSEKEIYNYHTYLNIGYRIIDYFNDEYQCIFALHEKDNNGNESLPHIHFAINPISYKTGKRIKIDKKYLYTLRQYIDNVIPDGIQTPFPENPF